MICFWRFFAGTSGLALPICFFRRKFRRLVLLANVDGKFRQQILECKISPVKDLPKDPQRNMVVVLAVKFWVVVPENLRNTKECLLARCAWGCAMRPYGKADGAGLYVGPRRVTDTKQNCSCYEHVERTCTSQKDQSPQDRIHFPPKKNFTQMMGPPNTTISKEAQIASLAA